MVRQMNLQQLQQLQMLIDLLHQTQSFHHQVNGADAAVADAAALRAQFIVDVAAPHQGLFLILPVARRQSALNLALGVAQDFAVASRSEEHTSELQSRRDLVCRLLLEKKKKTINASCTINNKKEKTI